MLDDDYGYLLYHTLNSGERIVTRNGPVLRSLNLRQRFFHTPLISIRKTAWKNALREMEWFLSGSSNINDLHPSVRPWWEPWADKNGIVHNNYGKQFRHFNGTGTWQDDGGGGSIPGEDFDQVQYLIDEIKNDPYSRRLVITTWNTAEMRDVRTPITNCHGSLIQIFCSGDGRLSLSMTQRSADLVVGVPHNWIQYWAFLLWLCKRTGREPQELTWSGGDCHIYEDHKDLAQEIVQTLQNRDDNRRALEPMPKEAGSEEWESLVIQTPWLRLKEGPCTEFRADDFELVGEYKPILQSSAKLIV